MGGAEVRHIKTDVGVLSRNGTSMTPASDVRIEVESTDAPPEMAEDEQPPVVVGIPTGAFAWS